MKEPANFWTKMIMSSLPLSVNISTHVDKSSIFIMYKS